MPLIDTADGKTYLLCINHAWPPAEAARTPLQKAHAEASAASASTDHPRGGTTMTREAGWTVAESLPLPDLFLLGFPKDNAFVFARTYTCSVCGYMEMYSAEVTNPELFRREE